MMPAPDEDQGAGLRQIGKWFSAMMPQGLPHLLQEKRIKFSDGTWKSITELSVEVTRSYHNIPPETLRSIQAGQAGLAALSEAVRPILERFDEWSQIGRLPGSAALPDVDWPASDHSLSPSFLDANPQPALPSPSIRKRVTCDAVELYRLFDDMLRDVPADRRDFYKSRCAGLVYERARPGSGLVVPRKPRSLRAGHPDGTPPPGHEVNPVHAAWVLMEFVSIVDEQIKGIRALTAHMIRRLTEFEKTFPTNRTFMEGSSLRGCIHWCLEHRSDPARITAWATCLLNAARGPTRSPQFM